MFAREWSVIFLSRRLMKYKYKKVECGPEMLSPVCEPQPVADFEMLARERSLTSV